jgi:hypothetical protein
MDDKNKFEILNFSTLFYCVCGCVQIFDLSNLEYVSFCFIYHLAFGTWEITKKKKHV